MTNTPILYLNIMDGLPTQYACDVFLWAVDKFSDDRGAYKAETFAREADHAARMLKALLDIRQVGILRNGGRLLNNDQEKALVHFLQTRLANHRLGGNVKSPMPEFETCSQEVAI